MRDTPVARSRRANSRGERWNSSAESPSTAAPSETEIHPPRGTRAAESAGASITFFPAAAKRCLGQLRGPIRVAINKRRHQIVVKVVELVLAVPQRKPQVDDALMPLHQADDQGGKALGAAGLRDVAVKLPVGPEI